MLPESLLPYFTALTAWVQWVFEKGLAAFNLAWTASRKGTEIAIVLFVLFIGVSYLGLFHLSKPKLPADTSSLERQIAELNKRLDDLATRTDVKSDLAAALATPATNKAKAKK